MARQKSAFRKRLNIRWLRHVCSRALVKALPGLGRTLNIPPFAVRAIDIAETIIENRSEDAAINVSESLRQAVMLPAMGTDTGDTSGNLAGTATFWSQAAILEGCSITGHTFRILRDSDKALVNLKADAPNWNYGKGKRLKQAQAGPELHAFISTEHSYYHFFGNELLPLMSYLERLHDPAIPLKVVIAPKLPAWQRAALDAIAAAWPCISYRELARDEILACSRLLWVFQLHSNYEWMPVTRAAAGRLVNCLAAHFQNAGQWPEPPGPLLFVSRREARIRQMREEPEIEAMLAARGFKTFVPGRATLAQQISAFGAAKVIVCVHGVALTNLLFCQPGTRIIEIFPANFVKSTYLWLATRLGLDYHAVIAGEGDFDQNFSIGAPGKHALADALSGIDQ